MIAIYMRVSTKDQQELLSQEAPLKRWAEQQAEPVQWFSDKASGKDMQREGFQRMECAIATGQITKVVVAALDRLGRDVVGLLQFFDTLKERNIGFLSLRESFDPFTSMGQFTVTVLAAVARLEREVIIDRIKAGINALRDPQTGKCPWGGRKKGTRIKVSIEKEHTIRMMKDAGKSVSEIARVLGVTRKTCYVYLRRLKND